MSDTEKEYDVLLIDTSIFDGNGLRLEKGLLGKLSQFRKSPIEFLFPDVIKNEVQGHLEKKIRVARSALEKSFNDAGDHLFFDGSALNDAKEILIDSREIEGLAESRVKKFISETGALVLECGNYISVSDLLDQYFSNRPPFSENGKKKNEFPDAIVLLAVEEWAEQEKKSVLAIAKDKDWTDYCRDSKYIDCKNDLSESLAIFNKSNAHYALLANLEKALENKLADQFLGEVEAGLTSVLDGITPDQDADSHLYWEPEGSNGWFKGFYLEDEEFRIIEVEEGFIVLETVAQITVEAEGEFSFSVYDSFDKDHTYIGSITALAEDTFESEILITLAGDLNGDLDELIVEQVEIVNPITTINFGTIEPDYDEYE